MTSRGGRLIGMAAVMYGAMVAVALAWGGLRELAAGWWSFDGPRAAGEAAIVGILLGLVAIILSWELERAVDGVRSLSERFATLLAGTTVLEAIVLAGLSSVGEEMLFRGCLQPEIGILPATALFAVVHTGPERIYLWWMASAFIFGLGLAWLFEAQGGLLAPILMHFVINVVNIRVLGLKGDVLVKRKRQTLGF